jgi:class 3 adenylate cyclase/tetratricopeptide (TPR) repeat protein
MQCPQCERENPAQAKFCRGCGHRFAPRCAQCGTELAPDDQFCIECGTPVAAPTAAPPSVAEAPNRFTLPQTYTPQHLAERILTSRGALEGERKQVTVLFADLKGSMELLADRDPEEARRILDPVLDRMMDAVHRYEGTVNQVMGDGIMALFGAPLAHEDHAVRACYAALHMQEAVKQYADEVRRREGVLIEIRVGLNSGEVVVRSIGSDLRMDYTAVGQTTHLAARMEQLAAAGSVLLAPDTLQLAEGYVQLKALGAVQVKGLSEPVEVYELVGAGTARSRLQAAAARGLTRFVGRDAELETLRRTLDQAGSGHGQIVALVGEPGVGKSRLVWEFTRSHRTQGWLVLEAGSFSYGKATSYLPAIDLLKGYCSIEDRDDARRMREKLTGKLLTLDPELQLTLPPLLALLDVPVDDAQWQALDPPQRRQRTLAACKRLLLRESQEQPLLLVFEDLHWIDAETQALLDGLVDSLPAARILLLVNYRPEYEHTWHRKTYYQQLRLDPLPPASAEELLGALLGAAGELAPLKRLLIERTEGNPFFVEESVRALIESGVLAGERGSYRVARPFERAQVPATVQAVLAARIDRLTPEDKRLLQAAAVIGKDVPYPLLLAIADLSEDALRQGLARLHAAEFLYETSLFPDLEFTFKHALTHEVTYGSLLQERRRTLHARIVAAIDSLYPDRLAEQVERLALHALRGEVWEKAVLYLRQAGVRASARSAHREAIGYLEQALAVLVQLPETREMRELAVDLRINLHPSLVPLGEMERTLVYMQEAERISNALGDQRRLASVSAIMSAAYWWTGAPHRCVEAAERARSLASAVGDEAIHVQTNTRLSYAYTSLGEYRRALEFAAANIALVQEDRLAERYGAAGLPAADSRTISAVCLAELGEFAAGAALGEEGIRIAETAAQPFSLTFAYARVGRLRLRQGALDGAVTLLERSLAVARGSDSWYQLVVASAPLGGAYIATGRLAEALSMLEQAIEQAATLREMNDQAQRVMWLAEGYLLAGRRAEAGALGGRALALAREYRERGSEAWALHLLGEIAAQAEPLDAEQAENSYRQAFDMAEELGMRPLVAHCHLRLGTLYQKIGSGEQARAELATASEMYRAMEMPFWLAKAEAVLVQGPR